MDYTSMDKTKDRTNYTSHVSTSNVTTITEVRSAGYQLVLHVHHIVAILLIFYLFSISLHPSEGMDSCVTNMYVWTTRVICLPVCGAPW